jgi:hypothetical protein
MFYMDHLIGMLGDPNHWCEYCEELEGMD